MAQLSTIQGFVLALFDCMQDLTRNAMQNVYQNVPRACMQVTGEAFQVLASCLPMLTELDVSECKITDSGLAHVSVKYVCRRLQ